MSDLYLTISMENHEKWPWAGLQVPPATSADFFRDDYYRAVSPLQAWQAEGLVYHNVATCPDCAGAMIRQGRCCVCPSCGFESCQV